MHGRRSRKKSKRIKLSTKYKVEKKVREHHRKLRKEMKKNPSKFGMKRADPGVPNSFPFKAELINEAKEAKAQEEERRQKLRTALKMRRKEEKQEIFNANRNISEFVENAQKRGKDFESKRNVDSEQNKFTNKSAKAYYKEFKKVVEAADVILEVLDARDPQGTRCSPMEDMVRDSPNKRLVLVLNKADLVPRSSLEAWLKYLRRKYPTILFKASTQSQSSNLSHARTKPFKAEKTLQTSRCVGADTLMQLLKNYCRNCGIKTAITVGVVGLPNVGKSSLINSLKRTKACSVGATPGITKTLQEVTLDSKVRLIDCPGVILPGENVSDAASTLRNALRIEALEDPIPPVEAILERAGKEQLMLHYILPAFNDTMEFLALLAKRTGKLQKGGAPRVQAVARMVLQDWNVGRIKYYTTPPVEAASTKLNSVLVEKMSREFSVDDLDSAVEGIMDALPEVAPSDTVQVDSLRPLQTVYEESEEEEEPMEEDDDEDKGIPEQQKILPENVEIDIAKKPAEVEVAPEKKPRWETKRKEVDLSKVSLKKLQTQQGKKIRKEKARNERRTQELVQAFQSLSGAIEDTYDFNDYFSKEK